MNHDNQYSKCLIEGIEIVDRMMLREGNKDLSVKFNVKTLKDNEGSEPDEEIGEAENRSETSTISSKGTTILNKANNSIMMEDESTSDSSTSSGPKVTWSDITLVEEVPNIIKASDDEIRIALNTISKRRITLDDINRWKNKNWVHYDAMAVDAEMEEYGLMKRIVAAILYDREIEGTQETFGNGSTDEMSIPDKLHDENSKIRASHPTNGESPPSKAQRTGEGQGT